jgi:ribosomal protein S18 acetylase RimI-like enzyme
MLGKDKGVGTIQGLRSGPGHGAIQNIGVVEAWRGRGVGKELIRRALRGFYLTGCRMVTLEVTTHNFRAIELYESVGFTTIETLYKYSLGG